MHGLAFNRVCRDKALRHSSGDRQTDEQDTLWTADIKSCSLGYSTGWIHLLRRCSEHICQIVQRHTETMKQGDQGSLRLLGTIGSDSLMQTSPSPLCNILSMPLGPREERRMRATALAAWMLAF